MEKIIVVGDTKHLVKRLFSTESFYIRTASSNREALEMHRAEKANLIVAGLDMPGMAGDELCAIIKKDGDPRVSTLLVCRDDKAEVERSRGSATAYITTPFTAEALYDKMQGLLNIAKRQAFRVLAHLKVESKTRSSTVVSMSLNISASGMMIESDVALSQGEKITCSFFLPGAVRISAEGEIVRVITGQNGKYQCGIKFTSIPPDSRSAIESFVKSRL